VVEIVRQLQAEGVGVAVLSGDHPATVRALAASLGIDGDVHGRVTPDEKARLVREYQQAGRTVAMIGDGVNDVLALKAADLGLAIGGGSTAARAVAAVVLLDGDFGVLPAVIAEGRRVIANVERLASLFLTKTTYAALLGIGAAVWLLPFPFLPRNLTLIGAFTIGIPAFFLALAPNTERARPGFLGRVARFALPAGLVAAGFTFAGYYLALDDPRVQLDEARTAATIVLAGLGIWVLSVLARPLTPARKGLIAAMIAALGISLTLPVTQAAFGIDIPHALVWLATIGLVAVGGLTLELGTWLSGWATRLSRAADR
jgi:cation-transporting P-type ATPase E